ncbi:peroxiredoxin-like family protein [Bradyrhizobium sp.]|uniref:peroxiredoxin-like family protein n=1 Tax=Bradyrhizobium sp. TaxID=376 RepID=UPI003C79557D
MTLQSELDTFKTSWLDRVGPEIAKLVDDDNMALQSVAAQALKAGDRLPAMLLRDQLGRDVDLGALARRQPLIVTFYRGGWCPYCNLELRAYQNALPEIEALGAKLVAVTPETPDNTLSAAEKNDLSFPVLSDVKGRLADALGIRFELSPAIQALYQKFGHDLPARNGDDRWSLPLPATFVVENGGVIAFAYVDPDYRKRLDPGVAIDVLRKLASKSAA